MLVQEFLERSARRFPDKVCLICQGQRLTYAEVEVQANRLAEALKTYGVKRGDRVVLHLPNSIALVIGIFATLKAGAVFVVVNYSTKREKLTYILNNCQARALLTSQARAELAVQMAEDTPSLSTTIITGDKEQPGCHTLDEIQNTFSDARPSNNNIDLDLACLVYTSGSTGEPKGVMEDHSSVDFATSAIIDYLENVSDDVIINVLPLSFDYGLYQLLMAFKIGGTLVLERGFNYPAAVLQRMETERVTGFPGVPTIFTLLLRMNLDRYELSSLRYLTNTAAALPPSHIRQIQEAFPWATLYSMYGLTETKRTLYLPPEQLDMRPGSVGIAIPGTEVWIENSEGQRLGPDEVGELVVRGRHVMRGYWGDVPATTMRFRPGPIFGERLCYTGDLFRMDSEGFFYFVARKDDIIKSRGEKVAPKEVENVLYQLDGIAEAAVIGVPDRILGQAIKAFVVSQDHALSEADVLLHCRACLEDFMVPTQVEFCDALPKTTSGKVKKINLK
jgi:amino acid adenylation domain-containing protein